MAVVPACIMVNQGVSGRNLLGGQVLNATRNLVNNWYKNFRFLSFQQVYFSEVRFDYMKI